MSTTTFRVPPMPDFVSDRERMLYAQVLAVIEPWLSERGYGLRWWVEQYVSPETDDEYSHLRAEIIGYPEPGPDRDSLSAWYGFQDALFRVWWGDLQAAYKGTPVEDDLFDLLVYAQPQHER